MAGPGQKGGLFALELGATDTVNGREQDTVREANPPTGGGIVGAARPLPSRQAGQDP